jgi:branched-chain amino acid transport system permease protein
MTGVAATAAYTGISIILALSCYVVLKAGEISFGQQAFFGVGAYAGGLMTAIYGWPLAVALAVAAACGALLAFVSALPLARLTGYRFTLTTLVMAEFIREILLRVSFVRRKGEREIGPDGPLGFSGIDYFYNNRIGPWMQVAIILLAALACLVLTSAYLRTRMGRELLAVAADARLAASQAIDALQTRRWALTFAGALAGLSGGLFAHHSTYIDASNFGIMMGVHAIAYVLIGGLSSVLGPVVGTTVDVVLLEWLRVFGPFRMVAFGLLLVAILVLRPGGLLRGRRVA